MTGAGTEAIFDVVAGIRFCNASCAVPSHVVGSPSE